jgi:opacity protein-like surface antigen
MKLDRVVLVAAAALLAANAPASAAVAKVGTLTCKGGAGVGMILGSKKHYDCVFKPNKGSPQNYEGSVTKIGLDLGFTSKVTIVWAVFASTDLPDRALAGDYVGASADASIGIGAGTKILVGGSKNSVSLQPLSVQGQTGLNLSVGVADLSLR